MADKAEFLQAINEAILDADSLEKFINGDDRETVLTRLSKRYPTLQKALKELFANAGIAGRFKTLVELQESDLVNGDYALVADDDADDKNGVYIKENGSWVKSKYDLQKIIDDKLFPVFDINNDTTYSHTFTDKDERLLAFIDNKGEFDFHPTQATLERIRVAERNNDDNYVYLVLDAENKILDGLDKYGNKVVKDDNTGGFESPLKTPLSSINNSVKIRSFNRVIQKMQVNTVAKGRSTDPDVIVKGDGLTHPKMLYIPEGWNGYTYWLAATPVFGVVPTVAYENPHVWASNDLVTWVEPHGAPLDLPEDNSSYWSDTHLVLDDDGWMYCIYRGCDFSFSRTCIVAKRSRDGIEWSDRIMIYNADNESMKNGLYSPSIFKNGNKYQCFDVVDSGENFVFTSGYHSGVVRRSSNSITSGYESYNTNQIVKYIDKTWSDEQQPWHMDAIQVGNMHLHLLAIGGKGLSYANELYLAYSNDGWNFKVFPRLDTYEYNAYRSSLTVKEVKRDSILLDVVVARTTGTLDLFELTLEIN